MVRHLRCHAIFVSPVPRHWGSRQEYHSTAHHCLADCDHGIYPDQFLGGHEQPHDRLDKNAKPACISVHLRLDRRDYCGASFYALLQVSPAPAEAASPANPDAIDQTRVIPGGWP